MSGKTKNETQWREAARDMRKAGRPLDEIASLFGVSAATISRLCKDLPPQRIVVDGYKYPDEVVRHMRELYTLGLTEPQIAKLYDAPTQVVSRFITGKARAQGSISRGSPKGERCPFARLTEQQVLWARAQPDTVEARDEIAERLGITRNYANILVRKRSRVWKQV